MSKEKLLEMQKIYNEKIIHKKLYLNVEVKIAIEKTLDYLNTFSELEKNNVFLEYLMFYDENKKNNYDSKFHILDTNLISVFKLYKGFNEILNQYVSNKDFLYFKTYEVNSIFLSHIHCLNAEIFFKLIKISFPTQFLENNINLDFNRKEKENLLNIIKKDSIIQLSSSKLKKMIIDKFGFFEEIISIKFHKKTLEEDFIFFIDHVFQLNEEKVLLKVFKNFFIKNNEYYYKEHTEEDFRYDYFLLFIKEKPELYNLIKDFIVKKKNKIEYGPLFEKKVNIIIEKLDNLLILENF